MKHVVVTVAPRVVSRGLDDSYVVLQESTLTAHELVGEAAAVWTEVLHGRAVDLSSPAVAGLIELGLIQVPHGVDRRRLIQGALIGGVATWGVTSLVLPEAAMALSNTGSLNVVNTAGTFCIRVPSDTTGTAHFSISGAGGGATGLVSTLGGVGGQGAKLTGSLSGLVGGDIIIVTTASGGGGGYLLLGGAGGGGYDTGGAGAAAVSGGGGGGGGATSIAVVHGLPATACPVGNNTVYSSSAGTTLAVAGGGGGGGSTLGLNGGDAGTSNAGSTSAAGVVGKAGGLLNLFGGGGGGGGVGTPAAGGKGNAGAGGASGWVATASGVTVSGVIPALAGNGGAAFLGLSILPGAGGGNGSAVVTFP